MKDINNIDFSKIQFVLMDLDGVLTDGTIYYTGNNEMIKAFNAHDGFGINRGRELGLKFAIISERQRLQTPSAQKDYISKNFSRTAAIKPKQQMK